MTKERKMTLRMREILAEAEEKLLRAEIGEYKNDAWLLFEHIFELDRTHYFLRMNEMISDMKNGRALYDKYAKAVDMRCSHIPLQHITGHQVFMGIDFEVNENVLTPRQDTEVLVEQALNVCRNLYPDKKSSRNPLKILDMCTGSGCIAISVKMLVKVPVQVTAVDLSGQALQTAERNAEKNSCEIEFIQSDLFEKISDRKFDIIISNPPYIRSDVIPGLMEEVKDHEPLMALDGDSDGLKFYRKITEQAADCLEAGGCILYEIGCDQSEDVGRILEEHGFEHIRTVKDLAGLDRVVMAHHNKSKKIVSY